MIFSIRGLGFELGSLLLEGWAAFAARVVCAALLLVLGWLVRQLLSRKVCPALLRRSWRLAGTPILLRSFAVPVQRLTLAAFINAAAASLPETGSPPRRRAYSSTGCAGSSERRSAR